MAKIAYEQPRISPAVRQLIDTANEIIAEYTDRGRDMTIRQLYYQLVARDYILNNEKSYDRVIRAVGVGRRAGLIDWDAIVDRTRHIRNPAKWASPAALVDACAEQYDVDRWKTQERRVEVWIEKDALVGVLEAACEQWYCPYFSCRGYVSDSEIWDSAQRMGRIINRGQRVLVLHLGDHDPSGVDMSRDIEERLKLFCPGDTSDLEVRRIALTMTQVEEVQPPPNPAKSTDSRNSAYREQYGDSCWELDALDPDYIINLVASHIEPEIDQEQWTIAEEARDAGRERLTDVAAELRDNETEHGDYIW